MDCYSAESEFIESLDFLSPPVKRAHNSREAFISGYHKEGNEADVHLLRGLRNKFARRAPSTNIKTRTVKTNAESSTSLILKKTSERQILEHYSIVSYTSLHHPENDISTHLKADKNHSAEKPLIKVTVIPKTDQIQTAKLLRKRRYIPKRVQSTSSNHENSVQTKNVYLIVAGRRREKIYEIKTTGSAKLSTDHDSYSKDEEVPVKEISNFKHLIQSLNMDRKKKKEKKKEQAQDVEAQQTSFEWRGYPECEDCMCVNCSHESPTKSRVKIFGQFGISEDDKYILRYGASVNDKTVLSDVAQLTRDFSPVIATTSYGTPEPDHSEEQQKDSSIQATCEKEIEVVKSPVAKEMPRQESQGTQVNFNVQVAMTKGRCQTFSDKKIQVNCSTVVNRSEHNTLKDCQSPLVIISVYPKPSPEDIMQSLHSVNSPTERQSGSPPTSTTYTSNQVLKIDKGSKKSNVDTKRSYRSPSISRSPSPAKKASSRSKVLEDKSVKAQVSEKRSPDRHKALRVIKDKIMEKDKLKQDASTRKQSKFNTSNATQVSKNLHDITISNATQVSHKNQPYTASNATQVSVRKRPQNTNFTVSNATQYSNGPQSLTASNGTQCIDDGPSSQRAMPSKHSKYAGASSRYIQNRSGPVNQQIAAQVSNATQAPKIPQFFANNSTQVTRNEYFTVSNATQVSKNHQNFIASRLSKNQETYTVTPPQGYQTEHTSKQKNPKTITERGTNTDHALTKKALVESYTKKLTEQLKQKDYIATRFDNSKVTINIDGDKEYYDVLFNQDKLSTDLTIKKTLKDMASQKCNDDECVGGSSENVMYYPEYAEKGVCNVADNISPSKSLSLAIYNNLSDEDTLLHKNVSRLTIRDSIELSHRREDKSNHNNNNIKNTQTCYTAQFSDNVPDETEFLAPIKHFTGDDCSICNPVERDKQIRELLGVDKTKLMYAKPKQAHKCENDVQFPYQCIYRKECKKSQVTEINFGFQQLCPSFKPRTKDKSVQYASTQSYFPKNSCIKEDEIYNNNNVNLPYDTGGRCIIAPLRFTDSERNREYVGYGGETENVYIAAEKKKRYDKASSAIYQQLILNRNIQVFLQVEQFSKQKPIILSRKQYNKVKKTIQKTISSKKSSHDKRKKMVAHKNERSQVSIGEVRSKRPKTFMLHYEKEAQTDILPWKENPRKKKKQKTKSTIIPELSERTNDRSDHSVEKPKKSKPKILKVEIHSSGDRQHSQRSKRKDKQSIDVGRDVNSENASSASDESEQSRQRYKTCKKEHRITSNQRNAECNVRLDIEEKADRSPDSSENKESDPDPEITKERSIDIPERDLSLGSFNEDDEQQIDVRSLDQNEKGVKTFVLFNSENKGNLRTAKETDHDVYTRKTMSSLEIRYASVAYMKHVAYSSTDLGALSDSSIAHVHSFHTIFRGHRKSATPNLGTSAYSLYSEECNSNNKSAKFIMEPRDSKPKKPFLRRLMSCLVMRSTRDSELKLPTGPAPEPPSVNSSIDSYHISTSLGAVEVSSSIYDTSASFYSNHTILPVNSKIKRGFFSSVRGFLTNRKS